MDLGATEILFFFIIIVYYLILKTNTVGTCINRVISPANKSRCFVSASTERRAADSGSDGTDRRVLEGDEQPQCPAALRWLQQRRHPAVPCRHLPKALRPHDTAVVGERGVV